ncbi:MAG: hypothetical protein O7E52_23915 [Candidatus Poribacteria bacterium]|nr:hypothetical protein [Candidatus Poribacteria bacterium]
MNQVHKRWLGIAPLFDPADGVTILGPLNPGPGWWVGAPSVLYDDQNERFYLYYRRRKPRELGRGTNCYIAESKNGIEFSTIWEASKDDLDTPSMEKAALALTLDGKAHLYLSYVDAVDNKWRTDLIRGARFDQLDTQNRVKVFTADDINAEGVKDPYVFILGRMYYMLLSYAPSPLRAEALSGRMHATADVYNTGITKSHTGLAISGDGVRFRWLGDIFSPRESGWDAYAARISTLLYTPPVFTAFYDGSASVAENYEERTGIAISLDLRSYERVTEAGPILTSPHASGSLRYMEAIVVNNQIYYYYEYARADGSHELRLNVVPME